MTAVKQLLCCKNGVFQVPEGKDNTSPLITSSYNFRQVPLAIAKAEDFDYAEELLKVLNLMPRCSRKTFFRLTSSMVREER